MNAQDYNEAFAASLRASLGNSASDYPLKSRVEELTKNNEVERLFPGRDKLWLQKELSKWRSKLSGEDTRFFGTLQSLQLYCTLTGQLPNDVLLSTRRYTGPARVEFLRRETILELAEELQRGGTIPKHSCALPVLYAPAQMTAVFLFIYSQKKAGVDSVCLRFGISEPDGYVSTEGGDCLGGISTAADSIYYIADLSRPEGTTRLQEAYDKIRGEFEAVCGATETPLNDTVNEFYDLMGPWVCCDRDDLLFSWYPPRKRMLDHQRTVNSLNDVLSRFESKVEQER